MSSSVIGCEAESAYDREARKGVKRGVDRVAERSDWEAASRRDIFIDRQTARGDSVGMKSEKCRHGQVKRGEDGILGDK